MSARTRALIAGAVTGALLVLGGALGGFLLRELWMGDSGDFPLLREATALTREYYLGELPEALEWQRGMIHGMVERIGDPHMVYVEPPAHELEIHTLQGEYGGIGVHLAPDETGIHLVPFAASPADRAGIVEGDLLLAVDDLVLAPTTSLEDVHAALRGPAGSRVRIYVDGRPRIETPFWVRLTRESFPLPSVTSFLLAEDPAIGVVKISLFSEKTAAEVETAVGRLIRQGVSSLILDLRGNSGGVLETGIEVARFFLPRGLILVEQQLEGGEVEYRAEASGRAAEIPLAVLIDGGTASAAEALAAALRENDRAPLVGMPTFGKGSIQVVLDLSDGSSLHVTTARWYTPTRRSLEGVGLQPDRLVSPGEGGDAMMAAAMRLLAGTDREAP